jgi:hypothetical protein
MPKIQIKQIQPGTNGYVLTSTGTTTDWLPVTSLFTNYWVAGDSGTDNIKSLYGNH